MRRSDISRIVDSIMTNEVNFIPPSNNPNKMSRLEARRARRDGRLVKVASAQDLYQDVKTSDFWKYSEKDNGMIRLFEDNNGIANFNEDEQ